MKRCSACRRLVELTAFTRNRSSKDGLQHACSPCRYARDREFTQRFSKAKSAAKRRNILWALSFEEYVSAISSPCFYCEGFFPATKTGVGLDRIKNHAGYVPGNVISCCKHCNRLKNDNHTGVETKLMVTVLIEFRKEYSDVKKAG